MPVSIKYQCDICGAEKQKTNHWFLGYVWLDVDKFVVSVKPFNQKEAQDQVQILCGESCAMKFIAQTLGTLHPQESGEQK